MGSNLVQLSFKHMPEHEHNWHSPSRKRRAAPRSPSSALLPFFLGGFPYQNRLQKQGTLILTSLLEDLGSFDRRFKLVSTREATPAGAKS